MNARHKLLAVALASAFVAVPLAAQARFDVDINIAPPPPRYEVVPPPRVGYVWAPGYWVWDGRHRHHLWHRGRFVRERRGEHWRNDRWVEHDGRWGYERGGWER